MALELLEHPSPVDRDHWELNALGRRYPLDGLSLFGLLVARAQALVTSDDFAQALLERRGVEAAFDEQQER
jgi:hypothetical protein